VALTQSLLYAAASDITIERVRALVEEVGPEAPTIEYKERVSDTLVRAVAALANTYGGLLLVGVSDDRNVKGVKEKAIESVAERCNAKIEPPWVPESIPVPLGDGSGLYVLVLRIVPGHHLRPLLVDGVAYVRHQNITHPADWQRLRDLFAESSTGHQKDAWNIRRPDLPHGADGKPDSTVDFIIKSGLECPVTREAKWRPLSEKAAAKFTRALDDSPLAQVMTSLALADVPTGGGSSFSPQGLNRSRTVTLKWWCTPAGWPNDRPKAVEATARLGVPGSYGDFAQNLRVEVDVIVRRGTPIECAESQSDEQRPSLPRWRVTAEQLVQITNAMLATLTSKAVVGPLAELAGVDVLAVPQPRVMHMVTGRPVTEVLDTAGLRSIPDAGTSGGAHLLADPALDLTDDEERHQQVVAWVTQIALDAGLLGMEQLLQRRKVGDL
jgi:hypothetical protein